MRGTSRRLRVCTHHASGILGRFGPHAPPTRGPHLKERTRVSDRSGRPPGRPATSRTTSSGHLREAEGQVVLGLASRRQVGRRLRVRDVRPRPGRVRDRLRQDRHPQPQPRVRDPDQLRLLRRRQDRARQVRRPEPDQRRPLRRPRPRAGRRRRRRGPVVLDQQGHRPPGHRASGVQQRAGRGHPGRLDDHPAVRQGLLPLAGAHLEPQAQGGDPVAEDPAPGVQAGDPPGLPQHHLLRARRLRHRGRLPRVLPEVRQAAERQGGRSAGRAHQLSQRLRPGERQGLASGRCTTVTSTSSTA